MPGHKLTREKLAIVANSHLILRKINASFGTKK